MSDRNKLRLGLAVVVLLFAFLPVRGAEGLGLWPVTLALAGAILCIGLVGTFVLWRSPPLPPEPPPDAGEPTPPK